MRATFQPVLRGSLAVATLVLAACSGVTVTTDHDQSAPFGKYRSYAMSSASQGLSLSPSSEAALRDTLRSGLAKHGLSEVSGMAPDLYVVRHVFTKEKTAVHQYPAWGYGYGGGWPYGYGSYGMWRGAPVSYVDVMQYTEGTLVLDFVDARTRKLVFRGVGKGMMGGPESNTRKVRDAVEGIIRRFPAVVTRQ